MKCLIYFFSLWLFTLSLDSQSHVDSSAILIVGGDLNLSYRFEQSVGKNTRSIFSRWQKIGAYDGMIVNLENPVTRSVDSMRKEFIFKMKPEYLSLLNKVKIILVNCANNHTADFGEEGILETIHLLDSARIKHVGIGRNLTEARAPVVFNIHGIQLGLLGYGGNGEHYAGRSTAGTMPLLQTLILRDIKKLKRRVDFVIVNFHWGEELDEEPSASQINLAHSAVESGADLIIGHHSHVLQGIEYYNGKVIAYSLGNFLFGGNARCANDETAVLKVHFTRGKMDVELLPVRIRNWQPEPADSLISMRVRQLVQKRSSNFLEALPLVPLKQ
jgi:poly-gamma-glutamate synthesis protein (capsule biosynthesis protein)